MTKYPPHVQESYGSGRKTGVEGTYGASRKGLAEKTVLPKEDTHDSGAEGSIPSVAHSLYDKAVKNRGDSIGDKALTER
jgi:hypothetical protein